MTCMMISFGVGGCGFGRGPPERLDVVGDADARRHEERQGEKEKHQRIERRKKPAAGRNAPRQAMDRRQALKGEGQTKADGGGGRQHAGHPRQGAGEGRNGEGAKRHARQGQSVGQIRPFPVQQPGDHRHPRREPQVQRHGQNGPEGHDRGNARHQPLDEIIHGHDGGALLDPLHALQHVAQPRGHLRRGGVHIAMDHGHEGQHAPDRILAPPITHLQPRTPPGLPQAFSQEVHQQHGGHHMGGLDEGVVFAQRQGLGLRQGFLEFGGQLVNAHAVLRLPSTWGTDRTISSP
jgi:hypothetical protein